MPQMIRQVYSRQLVSRYIPTSALNVGSNRLIRTALSSVFTIRCSFHSNPKRLNILRRTFHRAGTALFCNAINYPSDESKATPLPLPIPFENRTRIRKKDVIPEGIIIPSWFSSPRNNSTSTTSTRMEGESRQLQVPVPGMTTNSSEDSLSKKEARRKRVKKIEIDEGVDLHNRFHEYAEIKVQLVKARLMQHNKCPHCFLHGKYCVCQQVKKIFNDRHATIRPHITVYMHCCEFGKPSNTGKLLQIGMQLNEDVDEKTRQRFMFPIYGIKEDEAKMMARFESMPSMILYPSQSSRPIDVVYEELRQQHETKSKAEAKAETNADELLRICEIDLEQKSKPYLDVHICVLDSTWGLSKNMQRSLPDWIPRVNIDSSASEAPSLFKNRKQISESKVSTVEALALALERIGETEDAINPIFDALKINVDAVMLLWGKPAVYGNSFPKGPVMQALPSRKAE